MNLQTLSEIGIAFVPVLFFLSCLMLLDSFKLVNTRSLMFAILIGSLTAVAAVFLNYNLITWLGISVQTFSRFLAPVVEELLKIGFIIYLIREKKIGFMVDAAIFGFAIGTGFAIIENIYYMRFLDDVGLITWFVRGFGTAVMHGGATAVGAIIIKDITETRTLNPVLAWIPGLFAASLLHGLYNQFFLPPFTLTLVILLTVPPIVYLIFKQSEQHTREWLGSGLDNDIEMLRVILEGNISEKRIGGYMESIRKNFPDDVMIDIICYLRLYLELSVKAKGVLILNESGFSPPPEPEIKAKFGELAFLEKSIGKTGKLALQPLLNLKDRDIWQLYMLQQDHTN